VTYCCGGAIAKDGDTCSISSDRCVECRLCLIADICPTEAFLDEPITWPRSLRLDYSAVSAAHADTGVNGRGTAEMKDNDVSDRYRLGEAGFTVDVGRPGVGATFRDVEIITTAVAKVGVEFEPANPVTELMTDRSAGALRDDVKDERVLSCIVEFKTTETRLLEVVEALRKAGDDVNTVFSVGCISRCRPDGTIPALERLREAGVFLRPNGKVNIGLGRP
jgi:hypothetical protein